MSQPELSHHMPPPPAAVVAVAASTSTNSPTPNLPTGQWLYHPPSMKSSSSGSRSKRLHPHSHHGKIMPAGGNPAATLPVTPAATWINQNQTRTSPPYVDAPATVTFTEMEFKLPSEITIRAKVWGDLKAFRTSYSDEQKAVSRIVAVHGWLDNAGTWDLVAPRLAHLGAIVVCIDMAGHGLSDHRHHHGGYYLWDMVDDLLGVLDALAWPSATFIGHSTGAHISAVFAGVFPNRAHAVCMVDSIGTCIQFTTNEALEMAAFLGKRREVRRTGGNQTRMFDSIEEAARVRVHGFTKVSLDAARLLCLRGLVPVTVSVEDIAESPANSEYSGTPRSPSPFVPPAHGASNNSINGDSTSHSNLSVPTTHPNGAAAGIAPSGSGSGESNGSQTGKTVTKYQWRTDASLTLWAYLHCPEESIITFFRSITCPVLIIAADKSELFSLEGKKWSPRLAAFKHLRKETLFGNHHLHVERDSAESVIQTIVGFLGWSSVPPHEVDSARLDAESVAVAALSAMSSAPSSPMPSNAATSPHQPPAASMSVSNLLSPHSQHLQANTTSSATPSGNATVISSPSSNYDRPLTQTTPITTATTTIKLAGGSLEGVKGFRMRQNTPHQQSLATLQHIHNAEQQQQQQQKQQMQCQHQQQAQSSISSPQQSQECVADPAALSAVAAVAQITNATYRPPQPQQPQSLQQRPPHNTQSYMHHQPPQPIQPSNPMINYTSPPNHIPQPPPQPPPQPHHAARPTYTPHVPSPLGGEAGAAAHRRALPPVSTIMAQAQAQQLHQQQQQQQHAMRPSYGAEATTWGSAVSDSAAVLAIAESMKRKTHHEGELQYAPAQKLVRQE